MARLLIGLERPTQGKILIDGEDTGKWTYNQWRRHRTKIQAVFQDATGSLNRQFSVARNLEDALRNLTKLTSQERKARILGADGPDGHQPQAVGHSCKKPVRG